MIDEPFHIDTHVIDIYPFILKFTSQYTQQNKIQFIMYT